MIRRLLGLEAAVCLLAGTAAGGASAATAGVTDQFNGTSWSVVRSPVPGTAGGRIPDDSLDGAPA